MVPEEVEFTLADISGLPMINTDLEGKDADGGEFGHVMSKTCLLYVAFILSAGERKLYSMDCHIATSPSRTIAASRCS